MIDKRDRFRAGETLTVGKRQSRERARNGSASNQAVTCHNRRNTEGERDLTKRIAKNSIAKVAELTLSDSLLMNSSLQCHSETV